MVKLLLIQHKGHFVKFTTQPIQSVSLQILEVLKLFVCLGSTADFDTIVPTHLAVPTVVAQEQ